MRYPFLPVPGRFKPTHLAALAALGLTAVLATPATAGEAEETSATPAWIKDRGDIRHLPGPLPSTRSRWRR